MKFAANLNLKGYQLFFTHPVYQKYVDVCPADSAVQSDQSDQKYASPFHGDYYYYYYKNLYSAYST